jgi:VWFA-related protein
MRAVAFGSLAFVALAAATMDPVGRAGAQEPPAAVFPARSEAVTVDVVVLDAQGRPVKGLTREDFIVREDGSPRTLVAFQEVVPGAVETEAAGEATAVDTVATNDDARPDRGRMFLVLFDDVHLTPLEARRAQDALNRFLDSAVHAGDHVTVQATSGGTRRSARLPEGLPALHAWVAARKGLRVPDDPRGRISNWEAHRVVVLNDEKLATEIARRLREVGLIADHMDTAASRGGVGGGTLRDFQLGDKDKDSEVTLVRAQAAAIYTQSTAHARAALGSLRDALDALSVAEGRKTVLFVSAGFFHDPAEPLFATVADAARRANAAVDFLDARELTGLADNTSIEMERVTDPRDHAVYQRDLHDAEGTESVALETGGLVLRGRLEDALDRAARESEAYYLIGYEPTWTRADGSFHKIDVEVPRPGVTVRARRGYHATAPSSTAGGIHPDVRRALESPLEATAIPLRLASYVLGPSEGGKALVVLAGTADGGYVTWTPKDGRFTGGLETDFRVTPVAGGEPRDRERRIALNVAGEEHAAALAEGLPLLGDFDLAPGRYLARLVVRDEGSGRLGSVFHEIEVPGSGFRLSTTVLTDTVRADAAGQATPIPLARRTFDSGKKLYCSFQVLGATPDPGSGAPRVTFEVAVFRSDGTALARSPSQPLSPGPGGALGRTLAVSLEHAAPGEYDFVLRARDERTGEVAQQRERFRVAGTVTASAAPALPAYPDLVAAYRRGETTTAVSGLAALGPERAREEARRVRRQPGCDVRCLEAAALLHTDAAAAARATGETDLQLATARELLEALPDGPERRSWQKDWLLAAGYLLEGESRLPEARRFFDDAARLSADDPQVLLAQGTVAEVLSLLPGLQPATREAPPVGSPMLPELVERGQRDRYETQALDLYERALRRDDGLLEARLRRGRIRALRGQAQEAAADLETVARRATEPYLQSLAWLYLGDLEERAGRTTDAVERYRAALAARPGFQTAGVALAEALQRLGRVRAAERAIAEGLSGAAADPEDPWVGYHLGLAWRRGAALEALRRRLGS